jgi:septal ring factor EnvC (AmiA/AmiB activator)
MVGANQVHADMPEVLAVIRTGPAAAVAFVVAALAHQVQMPDVFHILSQPFEKLQLRQLPETTEAVVTLFQRDNKRTSIAAKYYAACVICRISRSREGLALLKRHLVIADINRVIRAFHPRGLGLTKHQSKISIFLSAALLNLWKFAASKNDAEYLSILFPDIPYLVFDLCDPDVEYNQFSYIGILQTIALELVDAVSQFQEFREAFAGDSFTRRMASMKKHRRALVPEPPPDPKKLEAERRAQAERLARAEQAEVELISALTAKRQEVGQLTAKVSELQQVKEDLSAKVATNEAGIERLRAEGEHLESKIRELQQAQEETTETVTAKTAEVEALQQERTALTSKVRDLEQEQAELAQKLAAKGDDVARLAGELRHTKSERDGLTAKARDLEAGLEKEKERGRELEKKAGEQATRLEESLREKDTELKRSVELCRKLAAEKQATEETVADLRTSVAALEVSHGAKETEVAKRLAEQQQKDAKIARLEHEVAELRLVQQEFERRSAAAADRWKEAADVVARMEDHDVELDAVLKIPIE